MRLFNNIYNKIFNTILEATDKIDFNSFVKKGVPVEPEVLDKIQRLLIWAKKQFFYKNSTLFNVFQNLKVVFTYDLPTMAVDAKNNIYINPEFAFYMYRRNPNEVVGVLAHEVMHHANLTFFRQKGREHQLWNICTDFIMNMQLMENGFHLPEEGCMPELHDTFDNVVDRHTPDAYKNKFTWWVSLPVEIDPKADIKKLTAESGGKFKVKDKNTILVNITDMDAEGLYHYITSVLRKKLIFVDGPPGDPPPGTPPPPPGGPEGPEGGGGGPEVEGKGGGPEGKSGGPKVKGKGGGKPLQPLDEHKPKQPGDDDSEEKKKIQDILNKAKVNSDYERNTFEGGRGGEGNDRTLTGNWKAPILDWKRLLKRFVSNSMTTNYTWSKLNKRAAAAGFKVPGTIKTPNAISTVIAIDCSGSISNKTVQQFIGCIFDIVKAYKDYNYLILMYNNTVVKSFKLLPQTLGKLKSELPNLKVSGGGNNESCIKQYLEANKQTKVKGFLMLTDGYVDSRAEYPRTDIKRLFLILKGGTDEYLKKHGDCAFIDMN